MCKVCSVLKETAVVKFLTQLFLVSCLLAVIGGGFFLATWDMPAPDRQVEKVIPAERYNG